MNFHESVFFTFCFLAISAIDSIILSLNPIYVFSVIPISLSVLLHISTPTRKTPLPAPTPSSTSPRERPLLLILYKHKLYNNLRIYKAFCISKYPKLHKTQKMKSS